MNSNSLLIKMLSDTAHVPTLGSVEAAGMDLYADIPEKELKIFPGETVPVNTGIAVAIPSGHFGGIYARSGLALKQGLRPANCVGVIDSDYRGPVIVALHNDSSETRLIEHGERIAQLIIQKYEAVVISVVDDLSDTERGEGGFGSTGTK